MPKQAKPVPFITVTRLIKGYESNQSKLAEIIGCSRETIRKRLTNPEQFTLGDLKKISQAVQIPIEEVREAIKL